MGAAGNYFHIGREFLIAEKGFTTGPVEHSCIEDAHLAEVNTNRWIVRVDGYCARRRPGHYWENLATLMVATNPPDCWDNEGHE
jgi:hypothetical protein